MTITIDNTLLQITLIVVLVFAPLLTIKTDYITAGIITLACWTAAVVLVVSHLINWIFA